MIGVEEISVGSWFALTLVPLTSLIVSLKTESNRLLLLATDSEVAFNKNGMEHCNHTFN